MQKNQTKRVKTMGQCSRCFGRGYQPQARPNGRPGFYARTCPGCGGTGQREEVRKP